MAHRPIPRNWLALAGKVVRQVDTLLAPACCVFCGAGEVVVCARCHADLPWIRHSCSRCAAPLAAPPHRDAACGRCQQRPPACVATRAPLSYRFPVDAAIKAMKFHRRLYYVPAFADVLTSAMHDLPADIDALLPVPLHWRRQALRGFNQAEELCAPLRRRTGLPLLRNLRRCRPTPYQSGLHARERRRNLRGAFEVRGAIAARHVLIVDDVITTGETCNQVARTLLAAGVDKVSALAIARADGGYAVVNV
jgi:ComF family protein